MIETQKSFPGWIAPVFFSIYLLVGLVLVSDYGISWDEPLQRRHGQISIDHIIRQFGLDWELSYEGIALKSAPGRQYSVLFSGTCDLLERSLGIKGNFRKSYLLRHRMVFLLFWLSSIFFYKLLVNRFRHYGFALLGTLFLVLSPRIFAHAFYNPKDIILLVFYIISSYTLIRYLETRSIKHALWHALATGLVINARMPGVIVPALSILLVLLDLIQTRSNKEVRSAYFKSLPAYLVFGTITTILFFPYLWLKPVANSVESFNLMAHFPFGPDVLYRGAFMRTWELPWHYIPTWMTISIPPLYLLFFCVGFFLIVKALLTRLPKWTFWGSSQQMQDVVFLGLFTGPLASVYLLNSNLYDGWRQLYFIYGPFLLIGMIGLKWLSQQTNQYLRYGTWATVFIGITTTFIFMVKNHPNQQVYFNFLAGKNLHERYEMDYWGVSYGQAFRQLIEQHEGAFPVHVYCANDPCYQNFKLLPEEVKSKIKIRWGDDVAEYMLSNFRFPKEFDKLKEGKYPYHEPVDYLKVGGEKTIGIFRLREEPVVR